MSLAIFAARGLERRRPRSPSLLAAAIICIDADASTAFYKAVRQGNGKQHTIYDARIQFRSRQMCWTFKL